MRYNGGLFKLGLLYSTFTECRIVLVYWGKHIYIRGLKLTDLFLVTQT